jgi:hypothetical protein
MASLRAAEDVWQGRFLRPMSGENSNIKFLQKGLTDALNILHHRARRQLANGAPCANA